MEYTVKDMIYGINKIADIMIASKEELTDIDSKLGDGDMGISMEKGALALKKMMADIENTMTIKEFFMKCASSFNKAAPSTMGTLLSGGMIEIAKKFEYQQVLDENEIVQIPMIMAEAIARRGKSKVGDKTILDALCPFSGTLLLEYQQTGDLQVSFSKAVLKARKGMEGTKGITAKTGRAKWLGERNKEYPDGGAYMCCRIVESFID